MSEGGGAGARRGEQSDPGHREGWTIKLPTSKGAPHPTPHRVRDPKNKDLSALQAEEIAG